MRHCNNKDSASVPKFPTQTILPPNKGKPLYHIKCRKYLDRTKVNGKYQSTNISVLGWVDLVIKDFRIDNKQQSH